jgi:hypothetical protein
VTLSGVVAWDEPRYAHKLAGGPWGGLDTCSKPPAYLFPTAVSGIIPGVESVSAREEQ